MTKPTVEQVIAGLAASGRPFTSRDVSERAGVTRQAVHRHLARLVAEGALVASGRGRATRYSRDQPPRFAARVATAGLEEDLLWEEARRHLPELRRPAHARADAITRYAFTEIVNNAIDHSGSASVEVRVEVAAGDVRFTVRDEGVGAYENVRARLGLPDHLAALQEISKGKTTTQPDRHTGEGLFFTSKAVDEMELAANELVWIVDNRRGDQAIGRAPAGPGTTARVAVSLATEQTLEAVFARYTHDFEFDTTRTVVKLFAYGVRFVSRSEAKRLLRGLERFRQVVLDFAGVEAVGQGFADEVFRVWSRAHPEVELSAEHMSPPVAFMVERARRAGPR